MRKRNVPGCICITPDGNRRAWRRKRWLWKLLKRETNAHERGLVASRRIIQAALDAGVKHVVLWAASESNIVSRKPEEIRILIGLLKSELRAREAESMTDIEIEKNRFRLCGNWRAYIDDPELEELVQRAEEKTAEHTDRTLTILFSYSGETEVAEAHRSLVLSGEVTLEELRILSTEELKGRERKHLWTAHVPNVDLHIRTGVRRKRSFPNFVFGKLSPNASDPLLPIQTQNTVLYFTARLWPNFRVRHLNRAFAVWKKHQLNRGA
ncbi:undecaprenyl diphosphate synthase family protein [Candidatus Kaiserbacteria bacterium]|nr:undecaprenyl diphosphate synthase family protein [Candidatus Kaiserbacteria bacterium]